MGRINNYLITAHIKSTKYKLLRKTENVKVGVRNVFYLFVHALLFCSHDSLTLCNKLGVTVNVFQDFA
jgi:hypothetical protein